MKEGKIGIHTENLLPIIKKWLYSEHDIFLRELISNAHDAITKLKYLSSIGEYNTQNTDYKIEVLIDTTSKTLTIKDNGIGLTSDEAEQYISQVAFSGAQDFVKKYEKNENSQDIIGFFGLGFYSAFMVSTLVEIRSLSYKEGAQAIYWKSEGNDSYELGNSDKKDIGTEITLHLDQESQSFLDTKLVENTIAKYSSFLQTPIFINGNIVKQKIALWRKPAKDCTEEEYTQLYKELFPTRIDDPVLYFHIKTELPFEVNGIFYFPKSTKGMEPQEGNVQLFVKDVFVGDGLKEIVPEFLAPLLGVIESNDIPLNVSRSQLQGDPRIHKLATHIENKFTDKVIQIFKNNREKMIEIWPDIAPFIKFGIMRSDHFYSRIQDYILVENNTNHWITLKELLENKNIVEKNNQKVIFYTDKSQGFTSYTSALQQKNIPYIIMESPFDGHFYSFLEQKNKDIIFARVDSELNDIISGNLSSSLSQEEKEKNIQAFKALLADDKAEIEIKPLQDASIPVVITANEQMRRWQEMSNIMGQDLSGIYQGLMGKTLILNEKNPIIQKILKNIEESNTSIAKNLAEHVIDLALLDTGALSPERQKAFINRSIEYLQ